MLCINHELKEGRKSLKIVIIQEIVLCLYAEVFPRIMTDLGGSWQIVYVDLAIRRISVGINYLNE